MLFKNILYTEVSGSNDVRSIPTEAYRSGRLFIGITDSYDTAGYLVDHTHVSPGATLDVGKAHCHIYVVDASTHKLVPHRENGLTVTYQTISKIPWLTEDGKEANGGQVLGRDWGFKDHIWHCKVTKNENGDYIWEKVVDEQGQGTEVFIARATRTKRILGVQAKWNKELGRPEMVTVILEPNKVAVGQEVTA